jgi:hypothetical protein
MNVSSQTLRNRRIIWCNSAPAPLGSGMSRPEPTIAAATAHGGDAGHHHCVCSDGCTGIADSPGCNGHPDADDSAHPTSPDDRPADAYNAFTVSRLDYLSNRDCGDEDSHA